MLATLPHDILEHVCSQLGQEWQALHLQDQPPYYSDGYHSLHRTLINISGSSRNLHAAVEAHLYSVCSGHAIFDIIIFHRTLQTRPALARHLRVLNIDVYQEERGVYGIVPRPPVTTLQRTWQQLRLWSQRNYWLPPEFRARDPWLKSIELPSGELWIDLIRRATNLRVLQMHTPQYPHLALLDAVGDMAKAVVESSINARSTLPLSRLERLSTSLRPIGRRSEVSCVDLTPRVSPHDWSCSAMFLPRLRRFDASYTRCEDLMKLAQWPSAGLDLRELRVSNCMFDHTFIHSMLTLHPNLRKLELLLHFPDRLTELDGTRVLQAIVHKGQRLEHLTFDTRMPYHEHVVHYLIHGCPSFRPLADLRSLEIDLIALLDFGLGVGTKEHDPAFLDRMHEVLPPSIESLTLLPRQWYVGPHQIEACKRRVRAWLESEYLPPALRKLSVGLSLRGEDEDVVLRLGGQMWLETESGGKEGRAGYSRTYELVRLA